jgi:nucleotide-binding universal stress UspA family protein
MSVVVAYQSTAEGSAAVHAAAREAMLRDEPLIAVDASRAGDEPVPTDVGTRLGVEFEPLEIKIVRSDLPDPADRVLQAAQDSDAALIVIGTRHRTAVGKFLLGSTTQRVLLEAACPVLVVKAEYPAST